MTTNEIRLRLDGSTIKWNPEESYVLVNTIWYKTDEPVTLKFIDEPSDTHRFKVKWGAMVTSVDLPQTVTVNPGQNGMQFSFSCTTSSGAPSRAGKVYVGHTITSPCRTPGFLEPVAAVLEPLIEAGSALLGKDVDLSGGGTVCIDPKKPNPL